MQRTTKTLNLDNLTVQSFVTGPVIKPDETITHGPGKGCTGMVCPGK